MWNLDNRKAVVPNLVYKQMWNLDNRKAVVPNLVYKQMWNLDNRKAVVPNLVYWTRGNKFLTVNNLSCYRAVHCVAALGAFFGRTR